MNSPRTIPPELFLRSLNDNGDKRWYTAAMQCENNNYQGAASLICEMLREKNGNNPAVEILTRKTDDINLEIGDALGASNYQETIDLISGDMQKVLIKMLLSNIDSRADKNNDYTGHVLAMAELLAGCGMADVAYNAASSLRLKAKTKADFKESERLFLMALKVATDPALRAAILVNYGEIVREGHVTGVPDYKKAIEIYAEAGELGQITGMYNAATVSSWLMVNDKAFAAIAEHWLHRLLDRIEGNGALLETDNHGNLDSMIDTAKAMMAQLHVEERVANPDMNYAIRLSLSVKNKGAKTHWIIDRAYMKKVSSLSRPKQKGGAHNWAYVLGAMDWTILGVHQVNEHYGMLGVALPDANKPHIDMIVLNSRIFKDTDGNVHPDCIELISELKKVHTLPFMLATNAAFFNTVDDCVYTPILVVNESGTWPISISAAVTPEILQNLVSHQIPFINDITYSHSCFISIAINNLALGRSIKENFILGEEWAMDESRWKVPLGRALVGMKA